MILRTFLIPCSASSFSSSSSVRSITSRQLTTHRLMLRVGCGIISTSVPSDSWVIWVNFLACVMLLIFRTYCVPFCSVFADSILPHVCSMNLPITKGFFGSDLLPTALNDKIIRWPCMPSVSIHSGICLALSLLLLVFGASWYGGSPGGGWLAVAIWPASERAYVVSVSSLIFVDNEPTRIRLRSCRGK